jgi:transcriptional regulator with GAF, ATPase, and Fis domain
MQQTNYSAYLIIQLGSRWTDILRLQPEQPVTIGRASECQVVVRDERVSRKHARIATTPMGWEVTDLGSRNGTQVDGTTIAGPHLLKEGETIAVGACFMTFSNTLSAGFSAREVVAASGGSDAQATASLDSPATIVKRQAGSQWSSEGLDPGSGSGLTRTSPPTGPAKQASHDRSDGKWNYFYRLVFELVACSSPEAAAQIALDRLLDELQLTSGGVVTIDGDAEPLRLAVLAARQAQGSSYHRVSDFLVNNVVLHRQAVLARNVKDDSQLSLARESGRRETVSIIVAPLRQIREGKEKVIGLLHLYTTGDERMLSEVDLDLAVGVADNLAIAITRQQANEQLARDLDTTRRKVDLLERELQYTNEMVGQSQAIAKVQQAIGRAGPTTATVLIRGESGVGKELVARAIHRSSKRASGPLICLNCAALAPTLLESELFGHEKGAFTGATERKIGKFEAAHGGTLLLDEIGEMIPELQAKFLRALEGQPFERLGGNKPISTDVRVIAATNRDLEEAIQAKEFRSDLYYRLRVIEIQVPPLRQRLEDVPALVEHFLEVLKHHAGRRISGIEPEALERLCRHDWPGNVRELKNVLERAVVLGGSSTIAAEDLSLSPLSSQLGSGREALATSPEFTPIPIADLEQQHIMRMLEYVDGNKSRAAQLLGIERSTLDRKLKRYST